MEEFKGRDVAFVSDWLRKKVFERSLLKTGGADNNCSSDKSDDRVGHLNTILIRGGGKILNNPIFKSSNAWALPRVGGGGGSVEVKFQVDRHIICRQLQKVAFSRPTCHSFSAIQQITYNLFFLPRGHDNKSCNLVGSFENYMKCCYVIYLLP